MKYLFIVLLLAFMGCKKKPKIVAEKHINGHIEYGHFVGYPPINGFVSGSNNTCIGEWHEGMLDTGNHVNYNK